jgi:hypothetical protein
MDRDLTQTKRIPATEPTYALLKKWKDSKPGSYTYEDILQELIICYAKVHHINLDGYIKEEANNGER